MASLSSQTTDFPFMIWTLQRTGGTNLTNRLVEWSHLPGIQHEPFNLDRCYGNVTKGWMENKNLLALRSAIEAIVQRGVIIKHCVEIGPWEITRTLAEATCRANYRHLFLYRKKPVDRLLSLHFAKLYGIWGPGGKMKQGEELEKKIFAVPLPLAELIGHEKRCALLLTKTWEWLEAQGAAPMAIAYEDIYRTPDSTLPIQTLLPVLEHLGLSKGETENRHFIQSVLERGDQGTRNYYTLFQGREQLELELKSLELFSPLTLAETRLKVVSEEHDCPWIEHLNIDTIPRLYLPDQPFGIGGVVVLRPEAPEKTMLSLVESKKNGSHFDIKWGIASPWIAQKFPEAKNAKNARFKANELRITPDSALELQMITMAGEKITLFRICVSQASHSSERPVIGEIYATLKQLATQSHRDETLYIDLHKTLELFPEEARKEVWLESYILLEALYLKNAKSTFAYLQRLQKLYLKENKKEWFDLFWAEILKVIHPKTLSQYGYITALANRNQQEVWRDISKYVDRLATFGYECFINSGTLLGAVRDGQLIAHDEDVDLAVVLKSQRLEEIVAEWIALKNKLKGMKLLDMKFETKKATHIKIGQAGGVSVDLFPAWIIQDRVFIYPHTSGDIDIGTLLPLKSIKMCDIPLPIPQRPEAILEINYGCEWRVPDVAFKFNWREASAKFHEFELCLKQHREDHPA
ncbi:MAG: LicD family protein [Magnetococcus sp. DMHC-6]